MTIIQNYAASNLAGGDGWLKKLDENTKEYSETVRNALTPGSDAPFLEKWVHRHNTYTSAGALVGSVFGMPGMVAGWGVGAGVSIVQTVGEEVVEHAEEALDWVDKKWVDTRDAISDFFGDLF